MNELPTPLHRACYDGDVDQVRVLVSQNKADLSVGNQQKNTPLHIAALNGHTVVVKCLLDEFNGNPVIKGFKGRNILHCACNGGHVELVVILLTQYNLSPCCVDDEGSTPLHYTALGGREEVAKLLITKYKCPVDCVNNRQQTPLHCACEGGHCNFVRMLVSEYKADLNARDKDNNAPLHTAASNGHSNVVVFFLDDLNFSPVIKGSLDRNLLHQSCEQDNESLVIELIDKFGLSLLSTDNDGNTPLHVASMCGSIKSIHVLLNEYQAPLFFRNNIGKSVVDVAKNDGVKGILLNPSHSRIMYDYAAKLQALSYKRYKGAHRLTRIFVVGNVLSGKSTLVESMKREGFFSFLNPVSGATVPPHTSGIIPSVHFSNTIGRVVYYDFAGEPEYYSSPSAIMSNVAQSKTGTNIFLVVVNLTKDISMIHEELGYWFSFISHSAYLVKNWYKTIVIGSHSDCITQAENSARVVSIQQFIHTFADSFGVTVVDILTMDCRQPRLSRDVKSLIHRTIESTPRYSLSAEAAILLGLLEKDFKNVMTCKLQGLITHIKDTGIYYLPTMASSLYQVVEELHSLGLLMSIQKDEEKLEDTLLLLDIPKLTNEVHKHLFSESSSSFQTHYASMGVLTHSFLSSLLPEYISVDCLVQLQYCQMFSHAEVGCDQSVVPTNDPNAPTLLYFPALCTTERRRHIISPDVHTYSIGWYAEGQSKFSYFSARFLHVLLLRVAYTFAHPIAPYYELEGTSGHYSDIVKSNCRCTMWKNGLRWLMEEGVECVVELVSNSRGLVVITKSAEEEERIYRCAKMLFKIIDVAMTAKEEFCHTITLNQYLMPLDCYDVPPYKNPDYLFSLEEVCRVLREGKPNVLNVCGSKIIETSKLAHLKEFLIGGKLYK